ncbi:IS6 family transposase [Nitrososphaera sp.]|uniref:IS6 family transposase n=1 Tax=Nitrososphaera sp. TaxID=1971748 RepID=UPI0018387BC5|nr:IS6 family transposase [Nitrososphaera sp.]NWG38327.1 IS6 family transposase [Nitrososphaera sp.]
MRINTHAIVTALDLYYGGLSMRKTAEQLENIFGESVSQSTIHYWVHRFATIAKEYVETLKPALSGKYHHDETEIKVGGDGKYFWETIDEDTRFIVASLLSEGRTSADARKVFTMALKKQRPTAFFTDGSFAYDDAVKVFYSRYKVDQVEWVRRVGIRARETNNIVERLHGTLKDRTYPMRGLKNFESAQSLLDGYIINYNFCRKHQSIKMTPAQAAGLEIKGWKQIIEKATEQKTKKEIEASAMQVKVKA